MVYTHYVTLHHRLPWLLIPCLSLYFACAEGSNSQATTSSSASNAAGGSGGAGGGMGGEADGGNGGQNTGPYMQSCPPGHFANTIDDTDTLVCTPIQDTVLTAFNEHCSIHFGWRDSCDGCTSDPAKWGRVDGVSCNNGAGADNTCAPTPLGETPIQLFGLNTDGDVGGDDKFYMSFRCDELDASPKGAPCEADELLVSLDGDTIGCASLTAMVAQYARNNCSLYMGWADSCDGCTSDPVKWGRVNSTSCENGAGADNTCTIASLGGPIVDLYGMNLDGNTNGDDKFYFGMHCAVPSEQSEASLVTCPAGTAVTGVNEDGSLQCTSPLVIADQAIRDSCQLYAGWRDSCDGCTTAPAKWGRVSQSECFNGAGADNTCTVAELAGEQVRLFGLNTDGDVDGNDKFYVGMQCAQPTMR